VTYATGYTRSAKSKTQHHTSKEAGTRLEVGGKEVDEPVEQAADGGRTFLACERIGTVEELLELAANAGPVDTDDTVDAEILEEDENTTKRERNHLCTFDNEDARAKAADKPEAKFHWVEH